MGVPVKDYQAFLKISGFSDEYLSVDEQGRLILALGKDTYILRPYLSGTTTSQYCCRGLLQKTTYSCQAATDTVEGSHHVMITYSWRRRFCYRCWQYKINFRTVDTEREIHGYKWRVGIEK